MTKTISQKYCINYKNLSSMQNAIKDYNTKLGYAKLDIYEDTSNCDNCNRYPSLMNMKVCFRLPLICRLKYFILGLKYYRIQIEVKK